MKSQFFFGSDGPRRIAALEAAVAEARKEVSPLDVDVFDLKDSTRVGQAISAIRLPPLVGDRRVVVWKGLNAFAKPSKSVQAELEESIPQAHPQVLLIAEAETSAVVKNRAATLPVTAKPLQNLLSRSKPEVFDAPPWWSENGWVDLARAMAREHQIKASEEVVQEVLTMVGKDSGRLSASFEAMARLDGPLTKARVRQLVDGDAGDLQAFHLAVLTGERRKALRMVPLLERGGLKPAEAVIRLQNLALKTLAVSSIRARSDAQVSTITGISGKQLYFRRKEWSRLKPARCAAALATATDLASQLSQGRPLPLATVLRNYLAISAA